MITKKLLSIIVLIMLFNSFNIRVSASNNIIEDTTVQVDDCDEAKNRAEQRALELENQGFDFVSYGHQYVAGQWVVYAWMWGASDQWDDIHKIRYEYDKCNDGDDGSEKYVYYNDKSQEGIWIKEPLELNDPSENKMLEYLAKIGVILLVSGMVYIIGTALGSGGGGSCDVIEKIIGAPQVGC